MKLRQAAFETQTLLLRFGRIGRAKKMRQEMLFHLRPIEALEIVTG